jgi:hypothetical protein
MRTTLDLPDPLFRELKARAAMQGMKMKELITRLIETGLHQPASGTSEKPRQRSPLPILEKANTGQPIPALSPEELKQLEIDEDLEKLDRSFGR